MNCLLINFQSSDFAAVLASCGVEITRLSFEEAVYADLSSFDRICIFGAGGVDYPCRYTVPQQDGDGDRAHSLRPVEVLY